MEKQWWKEAVVYQIYPRSFMDANGDGIGDLKGITMRLNYLQTLGIDVIWLSPVYRSPNDDNGYDISNYRDIMTDFGTMEDFDEMLEAAHQRGIRIMMDLVVNHSSDEHAWFVESRASKASPKRDYYIWRKGQDGKAPNNWGAVFGGSVWEYDEGSGEYYLHIFSKKQPDLNWENPKLRAEVYSLMRFWLDKGVDGFRMDVINFISKVEGLPDGVQEAGELFGDGSPYFMNGPHVHDYLQEMHREVLSQYDTITVGEMPGVTTEQGLLYTGTDRHELNMVFHFEHVGLGDGKYGKWSPRAWKLTDLKKIFQRWQKGLEKDGWNSLYWSNHDQPRAVSRFTSDQEEHRVVAAKMLATCLHMHQGTPYIYQGEELGMTNVPLAGISDYRDIESLNAYSDLVGTGRLTHEQMMDALHQRSRDNARTPVQWDDSENAGFTNGTPWIAVHPNYKEINAQAALADNDSIFHFYRKLIRLRKEHAVIVYGTYDLLLEDHENIYAFTRTLGAENLLVVCNFSQEHEPFCIDALEHSQIDLLVSNYKVAPEESPFQYTLKPYEARVYHFK